MAVPTCNSRSATRSLKRFDRLNGHRMAASSSCPTTYTDPLICARSSWVVKRSAPVFSELYAILALPPAGRGLPAA